MSDDRPTRDTMSIEEATVSNIWEIAAIVEVLERKGLCTKQDLYDIITEVRRKNPRTSIPETAFPEPYLLAETENKIIDDILELLNKHGLTSHQSMNLLERLGRIIEMGQRLAKETRTSDVVSLSGPRPSLGALQSFFPEHRHKSRRSSEKYL